MKFLLNEAKELGIVSTAANASHATHKVQRSRELNRDNWTVVASCQCAAPASAQLDTKLITLMALPCSCQHRCLMMTMMSSRTQSLRRLVAAAVAHWRRLLLLMLLLLLFFSSSFCRCCCCCCCYRICLLSKPRRTSRRVPRPSRPDNLRVESELRCVINLSVGDFYGPARHSPLPPIPPSCLSSSLCSNSLLFIIK